MLRDEVEYSNVGFRDMSLVKNDESILPGKSHFTTGDSVTASIGPAEQPRKNHVRSAKDDRESRWVRNDLFVFKDTLAAQD